MAVDDRQVIRGRDALNRRPPSDPDEEEETMTYTQRRPIQYLNTQKGAFDTVFSKGINTEESVFERTAVFRTGNGGQ